MLVEDIIQMMDIWVICFIQFLKFNILLPFFSDIINPTLKVLFTQSQHLLLARTFQRDVQYWTTFTPAIKSIVIIIIKLIVESKLLFLSGNRMASADWVDDYYCKMK